jgi:hypothetical protein
LRREWRDLGAEERPMIHEYDAERAIDAEAWLALPELDRHVFVEDYHRKQPNCVENLSPHAAFHVIIENQLAMGEEVVVRTLARLVREGLDRHDAVHALANVLAGHMYDFIKKKTDVKTMQSRYAAEADKLTAKRWRSGAGR